MARLRLPVGIQTHFLNQVIHRSGLSLELLARRCGVHPRTLRDWRREQFLIPFETARFLSRTFHVALPSGDILGDYWYVAKGSRQGGMRRLELYGPPGTPSGRKRGGIISQQRRREDPEAYRERGCSVRKLFPRPQRSLKLAELIGIILGDGGITDTQLQISVSSLVDRGYSYFIAQLLEDVFGEAPHRIEQTNPHCIRLVLSGVGLVILLESFGLRRGHKIRNQVHIPSWIMKSDGYARACVRGLFDTDGGLYLHRKQKASYLGWCFASASRPLLQDVREILRKADLHARTEQGKKLYLYARSDIDLYMRKIGTHNPKNIVKLRDPMLSSPPLRRRGA